MMADKVIRADHATIEAKSIKTDWQRTSHPKTPL